MLASSKLLYHFCVVVVVVVSHFSTVFIAELRHDVKQQQQWIKQDVEGHPVGSFIL
jgi:hypothetical protein